MEIQIKVEQMFMDELRQYYHETPEDLACIEEGQFYDLINEYPDLWESCIDYYTCEL